MKPPDFSGLVLLVLFSSTMLLVGLYLLAKFNRLFKRYIRNELVRRNVVVWMVALCLIMSVSPTNPDFYAAFANHKVLHFFFLDCFGVTLEALFVFNVSWIVLRYLNRKQVSFRKKMVIILCTVIICMMAMSFPINYLGDRFLGEKASLKNIQFTILFNFYTGCMTGLVYITMSYVDLDRKRKLSEKELEVSKLQALKNKAELDALHSKINPHFLYNALNSIADLSITDGKKARKMTIALADLFRYSINYSNNNYSTVKEELEMTEVYLAIEKIRFEDKLNYTITLGNEVNHYLIPRFILQPVVENAVKHGLKSTGKMTEIGIEVIQVNEGLQISVSDNGPAFPDELVPGYGVKSIYDKLDLLFPGNYEIHFSNEPQKKVSIRIHKLFKNEPVV
ncbi:MAG TPA: histidine kinase [Chitinophagaceae bacterium]|nr:histidine kinase [Chitinophagaceae bacterium]